MAPHAIEDVSVSNGFTGFPCRTKGTTESVSLKDRNPPPVADDFMYDFKYNAPLPTSEVLGIEVPKDADAHKEACALVERLSRALYDHDAEAFSNLFLETGVWQDKLAFTWDYRTFNFRPAILKAARALFATTHASNFQFLEPAPFLDEPYNGYKKLQIVVSFDTQLASASAVINAVFSKQGWKIYTMHTVLEQLRQYPEISPPDGHMEGAISYDEQRRIDVDGIAPEVLIIGGGQNGLALAARCKMLGMASLIIERGEAVGDIWSKRYEFLSLHFPHWQDDLPYLPLPTKVWPKYTPAAKQGAYMAYYAEALELNVWCKSTVSNSTQDEQGQWTVVINKDGENRALYPKTVVMATSLCGVPTMPTIPGMADFKGDLRHSSAHDSSRNYVGKRVCVVGTSSSGFDTAFDCSRRGIDVTLLQRSPTYVMSLEHSVPRIIGAYTPDKTGVRPDLEQTDRVWFSTPTGPAEELSKLNAKVIEDLDRGMLDGLNARGLRTWRGQRNAGNAVLGRTRNGGFYYDAGACKDVIDGKIKVESGYIESFTENQVVLNGGRKREFDLVVFATGFSNTVDSVRATFGDKVADRCGPVWGVDEEGEFRTAWKETGVENFWIMVGYLPMTRYHSKLLAMRLKALKEGISPPPYKA